MGCFCVWESDAKYFVSTELTRPESRMAAQSGILTLTAPSYFGIEIPLRFEGMERKRVEVGRLAVCQKKLRMILVCSVKCLVCFFRALSKAR